MTIKDDCIAAGISEATYYARKAKGLSHEEALQQGVRRARKSEAVAPQQQKNDETPDALFGLFEKDGKLIGIYNTEINKETLLRIATHLTNEALNLLKAASGRNI